MKKWSMVLFLSLCFMIPSAVFAADPALYGSLKLGLFMPNDTFHSDSWGSNVGYNFDGMNGFDNVPTYGFALGAKINPNIALEIGWEYYDTKLDIDFHNGDSSEYKITTWSVPLTGKVLMPVSKQVTTFLGAGVGYYDSEVDASETALAAGGSASDTQSATGYGFHAVAGADFMINSNLSFGLELKWSNAKLDFDDFSFAFPYVTMPYYMDRDTNIGGTSLSMTAKYSF